MNEISNAIAKKVQWRSEFSSETLKKLYRFCNNIPATSWAVVKKNWRQDFDLSVLQKYRQLTDKKLKESLIISRKHNGWRQKFTHLSISKTFALERSDHAFGSPSCDWGIRLTEPQVTKSLAHILVAGSHSNQARRICAFLKSIEMPSETLPSSEEAEYLKNFSVTAEENRIDLKLIWEYRNKERVLLIEAKFDHRITTGGIGKARQGQLSKYLETARHRHRQAEIHAVILANDRNVMKDLKGRQHSRWRFVSWRQFWLNFEKNRPEETDKNLSTYQHMLWHRIGRLNRSTK